jgi:hypothetical protein
MSLPTKFTSKNYSRALRAAEFEQPVLMARAFADKGASYPLE